MRQKVFVFFIPALVLFVLFYFGPVVVALIYSFTDKALTGTKSYAYQYIGFRNFLSMSQDPRFSKAVLRTILFLVISGLLGQQILGFFIAYLKRGKNVLFNKILATIILVPWVIPEVVAGFCLYAYLGDSGTLNTILQYFGASKIGWLIVFPLVAVIVANIWRGTAFSLMVYTAALDAIPAELEESANLDGASQQQILFYIVIPTIKESVVTNSVLVTFQTLGVFGMIYLLTGGGPSGKSQTLPIFMYDQAFIRYQIGYGTAISLVLLVIGIVLSLGYVSLERENIS